MTVLVFVDPEFPAGRVADPSQPQLSVLDQGVTRGDGVFETLLYTGGVVRKLDAHLSRLESSAAMCELAVPSGPAWRAAVETAVAAYDAARSAG
jgi:4-amino-4-deoxychorismate lyase